MKEHHTTTLSHHEREHKARYESDARRGDVQCTYRVDHGDDGYLCCALRLGHPGMHCHAYDIPSPTEGWFDAGPESE